MTSSDFPSMFITHRTRNQVTERIRRFFGGLPRRVQVAALPWRVAQDGGIEVMLVTSRGTGRWVVPKGWPEQCERPFEAAAREAAEEAGVAGEISNTGIGCFYYSKQLRSGLRSRCQVHVFPMEVSQIAETWPERKKRKRRWFTPHEAAGLVAEPDLAEMIAAFGPNPRKFAA